MLSILWSKDTQTTKKRKIQKNLSQLYFRPLKPASPFVTLRESKMVQTTYGATETVRLSRNYIFAAGRISLVLVIATLMVMMISTTYIAFKGERSTVALDEFDPIQRCDCACCLIV